MATRPWITAIPALLALTVAGCAGSGEGLDENGRPLGETPSPPGPVSDFSRIQETIFTPICTACHAGAGAPLGLRLDSANSYALLVGVASAQVPSLARVQPGNAEASYLVHKIEGRAAVGGRMPLGGPPLPQASIDLVRQWIAQGAPAPTAAAAEALAPLQVVATIPAAGERFELVDTLVVVFNHPVDAALAGAGVFTLRASGGDGSFGEGNETLAEPRAIEVSLSNPTVVFFRLPEALAPESYRLDIRGSGITALADVDARLLDGNGDGIPGGDHRVTFTITEGGECARDCDR